MDATISALLKTTIESLGPLKELEKTFIYSSEFWVSIISNLVALISSFVALLIAGGVGQYIMPWIGRKSELEVVAFKKYKQKDDYWRLAIKNLGREVAKKVQVDVTKIFEDNNKERANFLAVPLRWTHLNCESRDILPNQLVYLDVIIHSRSARTNKAEIATRFGAGNDDFKILRNGKTKLILTIYQENGEVLTKKIKINWPDGPFLDGKLEDKKWLLTRNGSFLNES